jgi:hypothetical protein
VIAGHFKARLLRLPVKLAPMLVSISDPNTIRTMLMDEAHEVLAELSSEANIGRIMMGLKKLPTVERGNGGRDRRRRVATALRRWFPMGLRTCSLNRREARALLADRPRLPAPRDSARMSRDRRQG